MKLKTVSVIVILIISASCKKVDCSKLIFDEVNKLTYKNNQLFSGKCYSYFSNSKIESIREYKEGRDHGEWIFYHDNNNLATKGLMNSGKKVGKWEYYFYSGELKYEHNYDKFGNRSGMWVEYSEKGDTLNIREY